MQSANGAAAAVAVTTGGGSLSFRRTSGAARPAASAVHATRRMAVERRTAAREYPGMTTFVFGYGSLLRRDGGIACRLLGHRRAWNVAMDNRRTIPGYKYFVDAETGERPAVRVAFLNVYPAPGGHVNGLAFPVTLEALAELDRRERNYDRIDVTRQLDAELGGTVWTYLGTEAARERFEAGPAVVAQDYFDAVRDSFATARGLEAFDRSTDPLSVPLRRLTRVDVPPPPRARR